MGEGYEKYLEGNYDAGKEEEQRAEDLAQAKAARATIEVTKIRLKNQLIGEEAQKKGLLRNRPGDLEEFYKDYVNREEEYLVDGAVLQCDQATWDDFPVPGGDPVVLEGDFYNEQKPRTTLRAYENPISDNGLIFATVSDAIKDINIIPFKCNCKIEADRESEIEAIKADKGCSKHGVCRHLMQLNSEWENVSLGGNSYLSKRDISGSVQVPNNYLQQVRYGIVENSSIAVEKEGLNMCSILFCKHGGIITPVDSGQEQIQISGISKEALRALMALEVLNDYSRQYLVIKDGKLIGIKPHLVGDGYVTVAFGDCLVGNDLDFYIEEFRKNGIEEELSDQVKDFDNIKDTVIPVDICFKKLLLDVEYYYQDTIKQFQEVGVKLSQNQIDAIVIAKYQCYKLGGKAFDAIQKGEDRERLYNIFLNAHGNNGNYESRTKVEMNIYFDSNYTVGGELTEVIVEPLEDLSE